MAEYHVGCGFFGKIYAGTLKKNGLEWLNRTDVTHEALSAVAQYLVDTKKEFGFEYLGKTYIMRVEPTVIEAEGERVMDDLISRQAAIDALVIWLDDK